MYLVRIKNFFLTDYQNVSPRRLPDSTAKLIHTSSVPGVARIMIDFLQLVFQDKDETQNEEIVFVTCICNSHIYIE